MNSTDILDAINARLLEKWPDRTVYVNVCPVDYDRPSIWLEVTRDDRTPVTWCLTKRDVQVRLTLHDQADEHYDINRYRLDKDVSDCLKLLNGILSVGTRKLLPSLRSMPREPDKASILLDLSFIESNVPVPETPAADAYELSVHVNDGEIYQRSE